MAIEFNQSTTNQPVISFEQATVRYRVPHEQIGGVKEYMIRWLQGRLKYDEFLALNGVSFDVQPGEVFGIVGRNGSGKSTSLKLIARVLRPSGGRVIVRGAIAPLLELGAGFNYELTGRENVYLNGVLLGHTKREIDELLPFILEFSEIGDFIDSPVRTYSSGMVARLGFAVATASRPDILLVDEVLSVGDTNFQEKCIQRMNAFRDQGSTIVFVSHSIQTVNSFCHRAVWLDHGQVKAVGETAKVTEEYLASWKN